MAGGDELAAFLRTRREAVQPAEVGLPTGGRRRTPGLRREEVAVLAGVSVTWYTWLEQARPVNASADVLDSLARALRLDDDERRYLHTVAGSTTEPTLDPWSGGAPSGLIALLDSLAPAPAFVLGPAWQLLGWNRPWQRLVPGLPADADGSLGLLELVFCDPGVRALIADWEAEASRLVAEFRAETAAIRSSAAIARTVDDLTARSSEFASRWATHDVAGFRSRLRRFHHPVAGELTFEQQRLRSSEWPELQVVAFLPVPGDDAAARLGAWHQVA